MCVCPNSTSTVAIVVLPCALVTADTNVVKLAPRVASSRALAEPSTSLVAHVLHPANVFCTSLLIGHWCPPGKNSLWVCMRAVANIFHRDTMANCRSGKAYNGVYQPTGKEDP